MAAMLKLLANLPQNENDLLSFSLDEIARMGAKKLLVKALQLEVDDYLNESQSWVDEDGKKLVVRNGNGKTRKVTIGSGTIDVEAPRVNDKRPGIKFTSKILPPYRKSSRFPVCSMSKTLR